MRFRGQSAGARAESTGTRVELRLSSCAMGIANPQNLVRSVPVLPRPYGIRVSLRPGDPFAKLLGSDWQKTHWYFTAAERDQKLEEMARKHEYSRIGDQPALIFEKVENLSESRAFS